MLNMLDPQYKKNPYPLFKKLREETPVCKAEPLGMWAVTRYDDVMTVLKTPEVFSSQVFEQMRVAFKVNGSLLTGSFIGRDPPEHGRLRGRVSRVFASRAMERMVARARDIANQLLDQVVDQGEMDLIADFCVPLPLTIIGEMLGIEPARAADFKRWTTDLIGGLTLTSQEQADRFSRSSQEFTAYFTEVFTARRKAPGSDIMSDLIRAEPGEEPMGDRELLSFIALLLIAGNETSTNLIANTLLALVEHPAVLDEVRADPSLIPALIEESIRYNGPVLGMFRRATVDTELGGVTVPEGAVMLVLTAAANHDETRFPDPERFDIHRDTRGHLGFGHGIHYCLGAPLARIEATIALELLLCRLGRIERKSSEEKWVESLFLRGLVSLPLRFTPAPHGGAVPPPPARLR